MGPIPNSYRVVLASEQQPNAMEVANRSIFIYKMFLVRRGRWPTSYISFPNSNQATHISITHKITNYFVSVNTSRSRQNGRHFADDIFKCSFLNEKGWTSLNISLTFVPNVRINNIPALVQIMAWRRPGATNRMTIRLETSSQTGKFKSMLKSLTNMKYKYISTILKIFSSNFYLYNDHKNVFKNGLPNSIT